MDPIDALHRLGGVASYSTLVRLCGRPEVTARVRSGDICRDARGRYALPATDEGLRAAAALTGVLSHTSAALGWGWEVKTVPDRPHVTVPRNRKLAPAAHRSVTPHWASLLPDDVRDGVTSQERTLADCLRHLPLDEALAIADSALRHQAVTPHQLVRIASEITGPGASRARKIAGMADRRVATPFESVLRAIALEVDGLALRPQVPIAEQGFFARPDLVDVDLGLVVEADSNTWHNASRAQLRRDCRRYTGLVARGWLVVRFAWEDVMFESPYVRHELELVTARAAKRAQPSKRAPKRR